MSDNKSSTSDLFVSLALDDDPDLDAHSRLAQLQSLAPESQVDEAALKALRRDLELLRALPPDPSLRHYEPSVTGPVAMPPHLEAHLKSLFVSEDVEPAAESLQPLVKAWPLGTSTARSASARGTPHRSGDRTSQDRLGIWRRGAWLGGASALMLILGLVWLLPLENNLSVVSKGGDTHPLIRDVNIHLLSRPIQGGEVRRLEPGELGGGVYGVRVPPSSALLPIVQSLELNLSSVPHYLVVGLVDTQGVVRLRSSGHEAEVLAEVAGRPGFYAWSEALDLGDMLKDVALANRAGVYALHFLLTTMPLSHETLEQVKVPVRDVASARLLMLMPPELEGLEGVVMVEVP